jgi:hypothetical protein
MIDDATPVIAQVIETDAKITDCMGWTYDLSAQFNIARDWLFQVDDEQWTWMDTNVTIPPLEPLQPAQVLIEYELDYAAHKSAILAIEVDDRCYRLDPVLWIPARQIGWDKSEIVTQLQQVNNAFPGGYGLRFSKIGYRLHQ